MENSILNDINKINDSINRRGFYRFYPSRDIGVLMRIFSIDGLKLDSKSTEVCMDNISAGGMAFLTELDLPMHTNYTLELEFMILEKTFKLESVVVRKDTEKSYKYKEYGVTFVCSDKVRRELVQVINQLSVYARKFKVDYSSCSMSKKKWDRY